MSNFKKYLEMSQMRWETTRSGRMPVRHSDDEMRRPDPPGIQRWKGPERLTKEEVETIMNSMLEEGKDKKEIRAMIVKAELPIIQQIELTQKLDEA